MRELRMPNGPATVTNYLRIALTARDVNMLTDPSAVLNRLSALDILKAGEFVAEVECITWTSNWFKDSAK